MKIEGTIARWVRELERHQQNIKNDRTPIPKTMKSMKNDPAEMKREGKGLSAQNGGGAGIPPNTNHAGRFGAALIRVVLCEGTPRQATLGEARRNGDATQNAKDTRTQPSRALSRRARLRI